MTTPQPAAPRNTAHEAAVRNYEFFCLAALLILVLALWQRGYGTWCLLPLTIGVLAIYARLRLGPVLLLLSLHFQLFDRWTIGWSFPQVFSLADLFQCASVLGYASAHYRLQGLTRSLVPADPREIALLPGPEWRAATGPARQVAAPGELTLLLISLGLWVVLAQLAWTGLDLGHGDDLGLHLALWRFMVLVWALGLVLWVGAGLFSYLGREHMTKDEASLFLQDLLWTECRGEQRRDNRWLAWARLRYHRRLARTPRGPERSKELP